MAKEKGTTTRTSKAGKFNEKKTGRKTDSGMTIEKELIVKGPDNTIKHDTIAQRAWEIWQQEGGVAGNELKHWFQAEQELANRKN